MSKKNIVILGSTGSIGINTLKVIQRYPKDFNVFGLSCYNNFGLFDKQIQEFEPDYVAVSEKGFQRYSSGRLSGKMKVFSTGRDLEALVSSKKVDTVVIAMRGSAALKPFLAAVRAGKNVAPANKEALVIAGEIIMKEARKHRAQIIPIDSEQSAIFQCLQGQETQTLKKIYLTASGGTLRNVASSKFDKLSVKEILNHPRWDMGNKITVDSATLLNKGFEVIEAMRLFGLTEDDIEVVVHPQAIIHSMVEFIDGSVIAQLGVTDMRLPIQYALTYPKRMATGLQSLDFAKLKELTFEKPDLRKFPLLAVALDVARKGGTYPSVLNASDEVAVDAYLDGKIKLTKVFSVVEKVVRSHKSMQEPSLDQILDADSWARQETRKVLN